MKKGWMWLLAAFLIVAMAIPAMADVNISGSYRLRGVYYESGKSDTSLSFYDNRLRFDITAKVSDDLTMYIQADSGLGYNGHSNNNPLANQDSYDGILSYHYGPNRDTSGNAHDIVFQRAYFKYNSPIGIFQIGRQWAFWGKGMLISMNRNRIKYVYKQPGYFLGCGLDKWNEARNNPVTHDTAYLNGRNPIEVDTGDEDHYFVFGQFSNLVEGLTWGPWFGYIHGPGSGQMDEDIYYTSQALKYVNGKLSVNAEFDYKWGNVYNGYTDAVDNNHPKKKVRQYCFGFDANYDLDIAKVGVEYAFFSGASADDLNKNTESKVMHSSYWYSPFVIFGNLPIGPDDLAPDGSKWNGDNIHQLANCYFFKVYATVNPIENLTVTGAIGDIQADENRVVYDPTAKKWYNTGHDNMGWEFDLVASYKITDNLSYSVAAAYFTAGDYYDQPINDIGHTDDGYTEVKGKPTSYVKSDDAYVFLHQIQITF